MAIFRLWQLVLANFPGQGGEHLPHSKCLQFAPFHAFFSPKITLFSSVSEAVTVFTDASECGAAAYYTKD
jgi:hypothetical protein